MRRNSKKKRPNKALLIAIILIIISSITIWFVISGKLPQKEELDEENLAINQELYNELSISKDEYNSISNVLLIATDSENGYDIEKHADVIMILSINQTKKTVKMISIPRDTYVDIEGYQKYKLNKSYTYGGEQLLIKSLNSNFDLNIKEYITVDFSGFIHIINKIGGIEMEITEAERKFINNMATVSYEVSGNEYKKVSSAGKVVLTGEQAVAHARDRATANDIARTSKHRDVLEATMNKIANMDANKILGIVDDLLKEVKTNIDIVKYTKILANIVYDRASYMNNIISVLVPSMNYSKGINLKSDGAYVIETDIEKAKEDFVKYMYLT